MTTETDFVGARDIAFGLLKTEWDAACVALSIAGEVRFQGIVADVPGPDKYWVRFSMQTVIERKTNLGATNRYTSNGVVFAQMFFPISAKGSWEIGVQLAKLLKNRLSQPSSSATVWFRNPRQNELTTDAPHHRLNVVADYEYDEIR